MIEQKLFFTRNGKYTTWEKIVSLNEESLDNILTFINSLINYNIGNIEDTDSKRTTIFSLYESNVEFKDLIEEKINEYFSSENINKCDFNGSLFKMNLNYINIDIAYDNLQQLYNMNDDYGINGIITEVFLNKNRQHIDIRLTSNKKNQYKNNTNEQIINTEVRIYYKFGLILMTDYSEYTHSKKVKDIFIAQ